MRNSELQQPFEGQQDIVKRTIIGNNQKLRILIFEIIGTFILTFGILCSKYIPPLQKQIRNPFHDVCISLSLYLAILIAAPFSGGHFNPAVTLGLFLYHKKDRDNKKLLIYIISQFIGAILGIILARSIYQCQIIPYENSISIIKLLRDMVGQFFGGFLFIYLILTVTNTETTFIYQSAWVHIFIPLALFSARCLSYYVGGLNPSVVISLQLSAIITRNVEFLTIIQIVLVQAFCIVGALMAAVFYKNIYRPSFIKYQ